MKCIAVLASVSLLLGAPAMAEDHSSGQQAKTSSDQPADNSGQAKKTDGEKKICSREIVTGSIFPHRVCKTQSQIDAENAAAAQTLDRLDAQGRTGASG